jgi:hypothetical protein
LMMLLLLMVLGVYLLLLLLLHDLGILNDLGSSTTCTSSSNGLILLLVGSTTHFWRATSPGVRPLFIVFHIKHTIKLFIFFTLNFHV